MNVVPILANTFNLLVSFWQKSHVVVQELHVN